MSGAICPVDLRIVLHSSEHPARIALADLQRDALAMAGAFARVGIEPGDVVAVQLPNWAQTAVAYTDLQVVIAGCEAPDVPELIRHFQALGVAKQKAHPLVRAPASAGGPQAVGSRRMARPRALCGSAGEGVAARLRSDLRFIPP